MPQRDITVISNVGDDEDFFGLRVSPDIDIVIYTLAGAIDQDKGWGLRARPSRARRTQRFGYETWFNLGDGDLATHTHRTKMLREGATLSRRDTHDYRRIRPRSALLPVSDDRIRTLVDTDAGTLLSRNTSSSGGPRIEVRASASTGSMQAVPRPACWMPSPVPMCVIAPSNPVVSIGPHPRCGGHPGCASETRAEGRGQPDHRRQDDQGAGRPDDGSHWA